MKKTEQIHLRCTPDEKQEVKDILKSINKKSDFIITYFLENYKNTSPQGLKIKKYNLEKELKEKEKQQELLNKNVESLKIKLEAINENINNKSIYDLSNYKNNEPILNSVESIKRYCSRKRNIQSFNDIPKDIITDIANHHGINEKDLIKIASNDFVNW